MSDWSEFHAPRGPAGRGLRLGGAGSDGVDGRRETRLGLGVAGSPAAAGGPVRPMGEPVHYPTAPEATPAGVSRYGWGPAIRSPPANGKLKNDWQAALQCNRDACFLLRAVADDMVFEEVNPTFETRTGLASASVVGRTLQDVLPGAVAAGIIDRYRRSQWDAPPKPSSSSCRCPREGPHGRSSADAALRRRAEPWWALA